jgi:predicted component of type VI protein secretion system
MTYNITPEAVVAMFEVLHEQTWKAIESVHDGDITKASVRLSVLLGATSGMEAIVRSSIPTDDDKPTEATSEPTR